MILSAHIDELIVDEGANGMDVVVHCLTLLENDPHFNAGKGAG